MVSSSSPASSDEGRQDKLKTRKKKRDSSPNPERRPSRKEEPSKARNYRGPRDNREPYKSGRDFRRENNNAYGERSQQRDRDREHRERRDHYRKEDERPVEDKRRHDRSPMRREEARPTHREYDDRNRRNREGNEYNRRRDDFNRQKKSSFDDMRVKREPSPEWGKPGNKTDAKPKSQEKDKPNFELSGKLTEDTNTVNGVIIKYAEPSDARKPKRRWRLYPFKGEKALPTLYIHRQSAYLMGRDRKIADIPLDHPSCSKQHAALQYRLVSYQKEGGAEGRRIRPYLIDLESANGTFVNNVKLEPRRYHELLERDVIKFGFSSREYVLLHEHSKDDSLDDDVPLTTTA